MAASVNVFYIACKSVLFKIIFETSIWSLYLQWKSYKKHWILLKTTSEITPFPIEEVCEKIAAFEYYKYGLSVSQSTDETFKKS